MEVQRKSKLGAQSGPTPTPWTAAPPGLVLGGNSLQARMPGGGNGTLFSDPGTEPSAPALQADSAPSEPPGMPNYK